MSETTSNTDPLEIKPKGRKRFDGRLDRAAYAAELALRSAIRPRELALPDVINVGEATENSPESLDRAVIAARGFARDDYTGIASPIDETQLDQLCGHWSDAWRTRHRKPGAMKGTAALRGVYDLSLRPDLDSIAKAGDIPFRGTATLYLPQATRVPASEELRANALVLSGEMAETKWSQASDELRAKAFVISNALAVVHRLGETEPEWIDAIYGLHRRLLAATKPSKRERALEAAHRAMFGCDEVWIRPLLKVVVSAMLMHRASVANPGVSDFTRLDLSGPAILADQSHDFDSWPGTPQIPNWITPPVVQWLVLRCGVATGGSQAGFLSRSTLVRLLSHPDELAKKIDDDALSISATRPKGAKLFRKLAKAIRERTSISPPRTENGKSDGLEIDRGVTIDERLRWGRAPEGLTEDDRERAIRVMGYMRSTSAASSIRVAQDGRRSGVERDPMSIVSLVTDAPKSNPLSGVATIRRTPATRTIGWLAHPAVNSYGSRSTQQIAS